MLRYYKSECNHKNCIFFWGYATTRANVTHQYESVSDKSETGTASNKFETEDMRNFPINWKED